jgi:F0F1-type ATP synthase assembly protein I
MSQNKKRFAADSRFYRGAKRWMGVGFEFLIVVGLCVWGGYWLDKVEGTSPGWMILGFFVGFASMLYMMIQRARRDEAEEQAEKAKELEAQLREEQNPSEPSKPPHR